MNRISKKEFIDLIRAGEAGKVKNYLKEDPSLAAVIDEQGVSALLNAVYFRKTEIVELLLRSGVELSIFEAAATGQRQRIRSLLEQDTSLANAYSSDGFTPLGLAAYFGHKEAAEILLKAGAEVNASSQNEMKVAPIHAAASTGQIEIARLLVAHGANVNARQQKGFTPLHAVAMNGQMDLARLLISSGANVNAATEEGKTPLAYALQSSHKELADLLRENGARL